MRLIRDGGVLAYDNTLWEVAMSTPEDTREALSDVTNILGRTLYLVFRIINFYILFNALLIWI